MFLSIPLLVKLLSLSVSGEEGFAQALELFRHPFSQLLLYLLLWILLHHLLAGIRFLLIDMESRRGAAAGAGLGPAGAD